MRNIIIKVFRVVLHITFIFINVNEICHMHKTGIQSSSFLNKTLMIAVMLSMCLRTAASPLPYFLTSEREKVSKFPCSFLP